MSSKPQEAAVNAEKQYPRFRTMARIEHAILMVSFTILAITGLPQKYALESWAEWMINAMGGIELTRIIHRWSAIFVGDWFCLSPLYLGLPPVCEA